MVWGYFFSSDVPCLCDQLPIGGAAQPARLRLVRSNSQPFLIPQVIYEIENAKIYRRGCRDFDRIQPGPLSLYHKMG